MNFIVSSSALNSHLQAIGRVIGSKNSLPILDCFLFDLQDNNLTITASDSETTLITRFPVNDSDSNGKFAISSKTVLDVMKEIPEQPININVNTESLSIEIKYQNGKFNVVGQNPDEYPKVAQMNEETTVSFSMGANDMLSGITKTIFATASDELRPVMNGIYFDLTPDNITIVASDGHKLVKCSYPEYKDSEKAAFILPQKPANMLRNILPKESGDVNVKFDEKTAKFSLEEYCVICRLIEGHFPNYNSVIPSDNPFHATIDRQQIICALRRVLILSEKTSSLVKLDFNNDKITISGQDYDYSTSAEEVVPCSYSDQPMCIGFKGNLLREIMDNLNGQEVTISINSPARPGIITPVEADEKEDVLMLLMPMMLNE